MATKRKIPMEKRKTKEQRAVTFTKRRHGLFNKAAELSVLCDFQVAVLVSSPNSPKRTKFYTFGWSSVDTVIDAFLHFRAPPPIENHKKASVLSLCENIRMLERGRKEIQSLARKKTKKENLGFWWDVEDFDRNQTFEELDLTISRLENLRENVMNKLSGSDSLSLSSDDFSLTTQISGSRSATPPPINTAINEYSASLQLLTYSSTDKISKPEGISDLAAPYSDPANINGDNSLPQQFVTSSANNEDYHQEYHNINCADNLPALQLLDSASNRTAINEYYACLQLLTTDIIRKPEEISELPAPYSYPVNINGDNSLPQQLVPSSANNEDYHQENYNTNCADNLPALQLLDSAANRTAINGYQDDQVVQQFDYRLTYDGIDAAINNDHYQDNQMVEDFEYGLLYNGIKDLTNVSSETPPTSLFSNCTIEYPMNNCNFPANIDGAGTNNANSGLLLADNNWLLCSTIDDYGFF